MDVFKTVEKYRVLPVVVLNKIEDTLPTLNALKEGGLNIAEITFRTACAADAIELAAKELKDMLIGAGTVINAAQCQKAIAAGAKFIVGPGWSDSVFEVCRSKNIPYFPGCVTPTEIMRALENGVEIIKFFPAQVYGGLKAIGALAGAFPAARFIPTGGVDNGNLKEFLQNPKIYAVGGSWMMKGGLEEIVNQTAEAMQIVSDL